MDTDGARKGKGRENTLNELKREIKVIQKVARESEAALTKHLEEEKNKVKDKGNELKKMKLRLDGVKKINTHLKDENKALQSKLSEQEKRNDQLIQEKKTHAVELKRKLKQKETELYVKDNDLREVRRRETRLRDDSRTKAKETSVTLPPIWQAKVRERVKDVRKELKLKKEKEVDKWRKQLKEKTQELNTLQETNKQQVTDLQDQLTTSKQQVTVLQGELAASNQQLNDLQGQLTTSNQQLNDLQGELTASNQQLNDLQGQLTASNQQVTVLQGELTASNQQLNDLQGQLTTSNQQVNDLQGQLATSNQQVNDLQGQLTTSNQQVIDLQGQLTASNQQVAQLQGQLTASNQQVNDLQGQLIASNQQVTELQGQLTASNQQVNEQEEQRVTQNPADWITDRNEIDMTGDELGRGAWATVIQGRFRRCDVAVKEMHQDIYSSYNKSLFEREIGIASRCRHPCLLQFIGATNDDRSPLIVTELMETSLRASLKKLSATDVSMISLDVALALNYLHQMSPRPIIHRDISSANVLLMKKGDQWRGKVSDYGTANFVRDCVTIGPGTPIYGAPETRGGAGNQNITCKVRSYFIQPRKLFLSRLF